jgi:hypothetical protein
VAGRSSSPRPLPAAESGGGGSPALQPQGAPGVGGRQLSAQGRRWARGGREASQRRGVLVVEELANHTTGRRWGAHDHNERRRRWVPDLHAHTTGGGETGRNGKVEQQGSQIGARFGRRWRRRAGKQRGSLRVRGLRFLWDQRWKRSCRCRVRELASDLFLRPSRHKIGSITV